MEHNNSETRLPNAEKQPKISQISESAGKIERLPFVGRQDAKLFNSVVDRMNDVIDKRQKLDETRGKIEKIKAETAREEAELQKEIQEAIFSPSVKPSKK